MGFSPPTGWKDQRPVCRHLRAFAEGWGGENQEPSWFPVGTSHLGSVNAPVTAPGAPHPFQCWYSLAALRPKYVPSWESCRQRLGSRHARVDLCPCPGCENLASSVSFLLEIRMATKHWIPMPFVALVLLWLDIKMPPFQVKNHLLFQLCRFPVFLCFLQSQVHYD